MSTTTNTKKPILRLLAAFLLIMAILPLVHAESMPPDVLARVKESATANYPGNYAVQKLEIDEQKKCYQFLSTYKPKSIPPDVLAKLREESATTYVDNFCVQKLEIEEQLKAYQELNK